MVLVYTVSGAMAGLASLIILARITPRKRYRRKPTLPAIAAVLVAALRRSALARWRER
jgi:ribose/xylose/arabinose/galactoside ABC-type transport system permease subunit